MMYYIQWCIHEFDVDELANIQTGKKKKRKQMF